MLNQPVDQGLLYTFIRPSSSLLICKIIETRIRDSIPPEQQDPISILVVRTVLCPQEILKATGHLRGAPLLLLTCWGWAPDPLWHTLSLDWGLV